ncbi:MAG TPA: hypothetical protein VJ824_07905 [Bacillota bacterium]|nr:hypothetical protein [Bacillota bacterium]
MPGTLYHKKLKTFVLIRIDKINYLESSTIVFGTPFVLKPGIIVVLVYRMGVAIMEEILKQILIEMKEIKSNMATKEDIHLLKISLESHHIENIQADDKILSEVKKFMTA